MFCVGLFSHDSMLLPFMRFCEAFSIHMDFEAANTQLSDFVVQSQEGCMSYTAPEDAQRPRAVYDTHPDFV